MDLKRSRSPRKISQLGSIFGPVPSASPRPPKLKPVGSGRKSPKSRYQSSLIPSHFPCTLTLIQTTRPGLSVNSKVAGLTKTKRNSDWGLNQSRISRKRFSNFIPCNWLSNDLWILFLLPLYVVGYDCIIVKII